MQVPLKESNIPQQRAYAIIDEYAILVTDPVKKLKFIKQCITKYLALPGWYSLFPPLKEITFRKIIIDEAERMNPGSRRKANDLIKSHTIATPHPTLWGMYKFRYLIISSLMLAFIWIVGNSAASFSKIMYKEINKHETPTVKIDAQVNEHPLFHPVNKPETSMDGMDTLDTLSNQEQVSTACVKAGILPVQNVPRIFSTEALLEEVSKAKGKKEESGKSLSFFNQQESFPEYINDPVWLVEKNDKEEIYSNRLRIITTHEVRNIPRDYSDIPRKSRRRVDAGDVKYQKGRIAGILYHASESDIIPFKPEKNASLKKLSELLLKYISNARLYHYFIDRFGRVYRIVRDDHAAYHAGNAVWADEYSIYLSLNHAFIGICFEGKDFDETERLSHGKPAMEAMEQSTINENQFNSGRELTDMLRYTYKIPQYNCVPHGLVSINPESKLIGYHLDLSHGFPFYKFGLSNKYNEALPSITEFGFTYDDYFRGIFHGKIWPGIIRSEECLKAGARMAHVSLEEYRKELNQRFENYYQNLKQHIIDTR